MNDLELELIKVLVDTGAPTLICIATIKILGVKLEELTRKIDACLTRINQRLERVETAIDALQRQV